MKLEFWYTDRMYVFVYYIQTFADIEILNMKEEKESIFCYIENFIALGCAFSKIYAMFVLYIQFINDRVKCSL